MGLLSHLSRFGGCRSGSVGVEMAFVLPVFAGFCLGTMELGRLYWIRSSLQFAVEETTRYAMAHGGATATYLKTKAAESFGAVSYGDLTIGVCGDTQDGDHFVTVTARYSFDSMTGLIPIEAMTLEGKSRVPLLDTDEELKPACS
jgi:Flp pilus assembly protein TadG